MKNILILFGFLSIIFQACKVPAYTITHKPAHPYVTLKDGSVIEGQHVAMEAHVFKQNELVIDDKKYGVKEVAFYFDGSNTYAHVAKRSFTRQVADGKLNLYRSDLTTYTATPNNVGGAGGMGSNALRPERSVQFWVQAANSKELKPFSYKSMMELIPSNSSVYPYLQHCTRIHNVSKAWQIGGFALMVSGIVFSAFSLNHDSPRAVTGAYISLSGAGICLTSSIIKGINKMNLHKIFSLYNKED